MAQKLSNLAVGSKVKMGTIFGEPIIWKIVAKNHKDYISLGANNIVTLMTDQIIANMPYDARETNNTTGGRADYGNNDYAVSNIDQWLNSAAGAGQWYAAQHSLDQAPTASYVKDGHNAYYDRAGFLNGFTENERNSLIAVKVFRGLANYNPAGNYVTRKIYLPGYYELNFSMLDDSNPWNSALDAAGRKATITAACAANSSYQASMYGGANLPYWTRDEYSLNESYTSVYVVDSTGNRDGRSAYDGTKGGVRPVCNLSYDANVSDSTDSSGAYTLVFNAAPTAPTTITVPSDVIGGENAEISWGASTDVDGNLSGYILEQMVDSGAWTQVYKGSARSYSAPITFGWTSVQYRVKAYDTDGAESAYTTSVSRNVTNNRPPVISGSDADLGVQNGPTLSREYVVTDADGHEVTVVEMLDGNTLRSYTVTLGSTNTLTINAAAWQQILNGSHTLTIKATDAKGATATRTITFTKAVTSIAFEQTVAMAADDMPTKALINIQGSFPAGCTLKVYICNNGNDASPAWEDVTNKALNGLKHFFTNTTKTASAWGVKVKVSLDRGTATGACYIQSVGGNFA